ncbi:MotA/TolQ/ExbB proton channel family protein [Flavihumibacter cheonanensis]|uniref:MotA/TolQ/ExbB proton channel family protein n=1 Tax=Flavihumibacter cheonanensis TaxID=1442385 RepID=UPI001EF93298|nr:MotA/TolQ/ExbB proton channel family protein [Flavihumibacter cheonanensis]MCG7752500.1 MotA/TolQ/ExbB proton channel family protein [Flavihumibacter cheonanensis]
MNLFLLQIADTAQQIANAAQAATNENKDLSMINLLFQGGPLMIPLFLLLIIAMYFFFERYLAINKASKIDENFMSIIKDHILSGNVAAARSLAKNTNNPVARIIDKGIQRIGKPIDAIEKSMENVGRLEMYKLERNLSVLSLVSGIAPMFGFLGTIVGMVQLFYGISSTGEYTLSTIASGIYVKMITSATGLIIGLLAYVGHSFLNAQVDKTVNRMEVASSDFIDTLQEPTR